MTDRLWCWGRAATLHPRVSPATGTFVCTLRVDFPTPTDPLLWERCCKHVRLEVRESWGFQYQEQTPDSRPGAQPTSVLRSLLPSSFSSGVLALHLLFRSLVSSVLSPVSISSPCPALPLTNPCKGGPGRSGVQTCLCLGDR